MEQSSPASTNATGETVFDGLPDIVPSHVVQAKKDDLFRQGVLQVVKPFYEARMAQAKADFMAKSQARKTLRQITATMDNLLRFLYQAVISRAQYQQKLLKSETTPFTLLATGGYGRQELFPFSDIDLLLLHETGSPELLESLAEPILYVLWDLGLKVGHAVRSTEEANSMLSDHTVLSSFLDARFVAGEESLYRSIRQKISRTPPMEAASYVEAKLGERDARHERMGDTRYILEPNIKDGKGGLRDLHSLYWIARYVYRIGKVEDLVEKRVLTRTECHRYVKARDFLFTVRLYLHFLSNRAEERLTFEMQRSIAQELGYRGKTANQSVERFMKHYFQIARDVGFITSVFCALLEEEQKYRPRFSLARWLTGPRRIDGIELDGSRLTLTSSRDLKDNPLLLLRIFRTAAREGLHIHPHALKLISRNLSLITPEFRENPEAIKIFLSILEDTKTGENCLRMMSDAGVLSRFIPDFGHIVGQMQFDMYHIYTVDQHTLRALGIVHGILEGKYHKDLPLATGVIKQVASLRVLYLAMLCHDIAKGRGGDHEKKGEAIALQYAHRFGFSQEESHLVGWLVREQMLFADVSFKRDLSDPATIHYFARAVQSPEKLRLLLVLTVADIRAVGPTVWNGWKGALMRELYRKTEHYLQTGSMPGFTAHSDLIEEMRALLPGWKEDQIKTHLENCPEEILHSWPASEHATIAKMTKTLGKEKKEFLLNLENDSAAGVTHLTFAGKDKIGLMADIAGAIALSGINILGARIATLKDGTAVQFWLLQTTNREPLQAELYEPLLSKNVEDIFSGKVNPSERFRKSGKSTGRKNMFNIKGQVFFENHQSATYTIVEVGGPDRVGLLYAICHAFQQERINIATAHINTYGAEAVDVFYIKDNFGFKITHAQRLTKLRQSILTAMATN